MPNRFPTPLLALLSALVSAALVATGAPAAGAVELDQESPFQSGFTQFDVRPVAQGFVPGLSGQLETVEIFASQLSPTGNLLISIYSVAGGMLPLPGNGVPIATGSIAVAALPSSAAGGTGPAWVAIDLDTPVAISAGEPLALVVQKDSGGSGAGGVAWFGSPALYPFGDGVHYDPGGLVFCTFPSTCEPTIAPPSWVPFPALDLAFRTYVPEPASSPALATVAAGLAVLASVRGRRHPRAPRRDPRSA